MTDPAAPQRSHLPDQYHPPAWGSFPPRAPSVLTIGDITITNSEVIVPHGRFPLRGTTWTVQDATQTESVIPTYAFVLMVLFLFFCLLGLLFLLIHEKRYSGFVLVSVVGPGLYHSVQFPAGPHTVIQVTHQVNQARALAAIA